jgi:LysR family glycine cleavage system transcriptional activator
MNFPAQAHDKALPLRATPQISALLAFERTASLMSFSRAAVELAVTPSAVSHQIRSLEQYFGTQLFVRGGKTISLTEQGEAFAAEVRAGLAQLDWASRNLLRRGRANRDQLRVRICPDLAHLILLDAFSAFERRHPNLCVSIDVASTGRRVDADGPLIIVQTGKADLNNMRLHPLMDVWMVPVASRALKIDDIDDREALACHRLIHTRSHPTAWRDWMASEEGEPAQGAAAIWVEGLAPALQAAEAGLGIALAPWPLIASGPRADQLRIGNSRDPARRQTLYLACRPEQKDDRRVTAFTAWLSDHLAEVSSPVVTDLAV